MSNTEKTFLACTCDMHTLQIMVGKDPRDGSSVSLTILGPMPKRRGFTSWWRLKEAWHTFRTGQPYTEWVLFENDELFELQKIVNDAVDAYTTADE